MALIRRLAIGCAVLMILGHGVVAAQEMNWVQKVSPPSRYKHAMAFDPVLGQVVLFGGFKSGKLGDTWVWDGVNWYQKFPANSPAARYNHAMVYDATRSEVVLFGGFGSSRLDDTWVWDGTNWEQKSPANHPPSRYGHALAYDGARHQVVLFGGQTGSVMLEDTWVWDGVNWTQKSPPSSPTSRYSHSMAFDAGTGRNQVVLFGGQGAGGSLSDTWVWGGSIWTPKSLATSPGARSRQTMVYDAVRSQVVLFGGIESGFNFFADTWVWEGANWVQESPATNPPGRGDPAMVYDAARGKVLLFGGISPSVVYMNDNWIWDGTNWAMQNSGPPNRFGHAMAYDAARAQVVLFGGDPFGQPKYNEGNGSNDTWIWNGTKWTLKNPTHKPPARFRHAMAYDEANGKVVLFGGVTVENPTGYLWSTTTLGDTWIWNGVDWTLGAGGATARYAHGMAYDRGLGKIVMAGGYYFRFYEDSDLHPVDDTWIFDGTNWIQQNPSVHPPAAATSAMAWDDARGQVVLYVGSDTWVWTGTNWLKKVVISNPPAREYHAMAYDEAHNQVVLFGGWLSNSFFNDTWLWGAWGFFHQLQWTMRNPDNYPSARSEHAMAYDAARRQVVLFGGRNDQQLLGDTWVWQATYNLCLPVLRK